MRFIFTNEFKISKLDEIIQYLAGPRLWIPQRDYPDYYDWLDKVYRQVKKEKKRAVIALSRNEVVGVVIYQKHLKIKQCLEIKNLTVRPNVRGRYVASFLMRNAEFLGEREYKCKKVICDTKAHNFAIRSFLLRHSYLPQGFSDLYKLKSGRDIVFTKSLVNIPKINS